MSKNICIIIVCIILGVGCIYEKGKTEFPIESLIQQAPSTYPVLFAPKLLLRNNNNRDISFTPDFKEFYFTQIINDTFILMYSRYELGEWQTPTIAPFSGVYNDFEPCISSDGMNFYFVSDRPSKGKEEMKNDFDIWKMNRDGYSWSEPILLDERINTNCMEYYPSITESGDLYFGRNDLALTRGDIYYFQNIDNEFNKAEKLPEIVNLPGTSFNAFIAPDESYLIFSTYIQDCLSWHSDLYISFKDENGNWNNPQNMGLQINSKYNELSPWVSHDGKYLFFASTRLDTTGTNKNYDIFLISAEIIENYSPKK